MMPRFGELAFPTPYGVLTALGLVLGLWLLGRLARRVGLSRASAQDVVVWSCLLGLVGAKLLMVALAPGELLRDPAAILFQGGVFYGGLVTAIVAVVVICWRRGLDPQRLGDACAAPLALGHAFGRIGCWLAGCCWGDSCSLPWAVTYADERSVAGASQWPRWIAVHPSQLYEAAGNLLLAGLALHVLRRRRWVGQTWWSYVVAYGVLRVVLELFRGDPRGEWLGGAVSTSQVVGACAIVVGVAFLARGAWRHRRRAEEPTVEEAPEPVEAAPGESLP